MTVFIGDSGRVLLRRKGSDQYMYTEVNVSDVRPDVNRFSVDFAHEQLIVGDRLEISTVNGEDLTWIDHPDADRMFTRFVHVDAAGGLRLYDTFSDAIRGDKENSIALKSPVNAQEVQLRVVEGGDSRCLAEVSSYEITTTRETIDLTSLGSYYRKQYESGLIEGQGRLECLWTAPSHLSCEYGGVERLEFASYLARLCIRLVHGSAFHGQFFIYTAPNAESRSVWYESETCIVTNVALTVTPTDLIQTSIDFVTSGPIALREGYSSGFLQLENEFYVLQEDASPGQIELENPD